MQAQEAINPSPRTPRENRLNATRRSGIGPQRALEANTKKPRAQRENPFSPEPPQRAQDRSRGAHQNRSGAGSNLCKHWKRSNLPLAHSAKVHPPPSFPARDGSVPRSPPKPQRSGIEPVQALEAIKLSPRAQRESSPSPELPCARRFGPAEPTKPAAERDRTRASTGSDQTLPSRTARKFTLPRASLRATVRSRGARFQWNPRLRLAARFSKGQSRCNQAYG